MTFMAVSNVSIYLGKQLCFVFAEAAALISHSSNQ